MAQRRRPGRKRAAASAADEPLQPLSSEELRRQAEARLDVLSAAALPAPAELAAAVHELRVHQIELEMQNEELRRAQLEAETLRVQYAELFFMAPVGYFTLGNRGIVGEANHTAAGLLGVERRELVGQPFSAFVLAADRDTYYRHLELLQQSEEAQSCEVRLKPVGGEPFWARLEGRSQGDAGDESRSYNLTFADVDKRVFAEEALRRRENELRIVLETVPDAVFHVDRDYRLVFANEGWVRATTTTQGKAVAIGEPVLASGYSPDVIEAWRGYYDRALGGESFAEVLTFASADGTYYTENQFSPVREADGEVSGVIVTSRDVSERRRVEGQLDDERLRFKLLVENSAEAFLMTQPDGTLLGANPAACRMFGRSEEELCRLGRAGIVDVTDPRLAAILEEGARTGSAAGEVRLLRSDRTTFPGEVSSSVYSDHLGNERSSMSIRDLSERREAEEALRKFDRLFHGNPALMAVSSVSDGRFTEVNEAFLAALGYSREEIVGHTTDELGLFIEPEQQRDVAEQIQAQGRASDCELKVLCRDGSILDGLFSGEIIESQGQQYFLTVMIDHTERKRAEKAVRASRKQLACAVDGSGVGLWDWQVQSGEETFSEHWAGILGYTLAELAPTSVETWRSRSHPDDLRRDDELLEEHFCGRSPSYSCEMRLRHKDGHWVWVLDCGKVTEWDEGGRPLRMIGTALDVSERKQVERALARSESRYRSLFEDSPVAMWEEDHAAVKARLEELLAAGVGDIESYLREHPGEYERCLGLTRTLDANAAAVALFEAASREELVARQDEVYPRGVVGSLPAFWAALLAGRREASGEEVNLTLKGHELQMLETASVAPGHEESWARLYFADVDVTKRRAAEAEILRLNAELEQRVATRTAQLEAANKELESFAYSVSHDLRAPLRAIDGFSQMVFEDAGEKLSTEDMDHLQRVRSGAQRMAALIDQLLGLSRTTRNEMLVEEVDLSALAADVLAELREADPSREVETVVAPGLRATADATLLRAILANLLGNAWKFTGKHATARIEVGVTDAGGERAFYVRDDGAGFDPAYAVRLFGAFQRMHTPGQFEGDGIGLATVQRLVSRHGGRVWAEAEVEKGAIFYFTLAEPRAAA